MNSPCLATPRCREPAAARAAHDDDDMVYHLRIRPAALTGPQIMLTCANSTAFLPGGCLGFESRLLSDPGDSNTSAGALSSATPTHSPRPLASFRGSSSSALPSCCSQPPAPRSLVCTLPHHDTSLER